MEVEKNQVLVVNQYEVGAVRDIIFLPQLGKIALRINYLPMNAKNASLGIPKRLSNSLHLMSVSDQLDNKAFDDGSLSCFSSLYPLLLLLRLGL